VLMCASAEVKETYGVSMKSPFIEFPCLSKFFTARVGVLPNAVAGALFILVSIVGFMECGQYSPMIGSGIGTWLLIRSWDSSRKKGAE